MNAGSPIPTLEDLQAGANRAVRSDIARQLGELTMRCTDAEAIAEMWRRQAGHLQAALNGAVEDLTAAGEREQAVRAELEASRADLASAQQTASHLSQELDAAKAQMYAARTASARAAPRKRR